jgi:hypothetical protein
LPFSISANSNPNSIKRLGISYFEDYINLRTIEFSASLISLPAKYFKNRP